MYEWLKDFQNISQEVDYLEFSIERYKTELKRWVEGDLQDVHLNEKSKASNLEEIIQKSKEALRIKQDQKQQLIKLISKFKGLENQILRMKYVEGKTLEDIAEELCYSSSHISKKHAEIMRIIRFADNTAAMS
ncbi:RNA polymerase sigma factor, sigma-70 family [Amphibacillus marinus]|uniref:RNA polymerase sigma factor, sigma-70 family n=1 Tax=Amphibacillus marinus TaxID=872970 RepID=A0A1H8K347_9BACI|nr:sigma factor-like helix-turn-helix DNA-binding protein [Amphibacillus marinus]SEN86808.1 RNA polymerase sigma factor, sigma-70 family [Amphibacillus marinus]